MRNIDSALDTDHALPRMASNLRPSHFQPVSTANSNPFAPDPFGNITEQVLDTDMDVENVSDLSLSQPVVEDLELPTLVDDSDTDSDDPSVDSGVQRCAFGEITNTFVGYGHYGYGYFF